MKIRMRIARRAQHINGLGEEHYSALLVAVPCVENNPVWGSVARPDGALELKFMTHAAAAALSGIEFDVEISEVPA